jgi:hypothetical protein
LAQREILPARNMEHIKMLKNFQFDHVLAVSALNQTGVDKIVLKLQELISKLN